MYTTDCSRRRRDYNLSNLKSQNHATSVGSPGFHLDKIQTRWIFLDKSGPEVYNASVSRY